MVQRRLSDFEVKQTREIMRHVTTPQGMGPEPIDRNIPRVGTGQVAVTSIPAQISYVDRNKISTKITNLSSVDVFWGTNAGVTSSNGDLLPAGRGNWVSIPLAKIIFVVCASGSTATISWAEAYVEEEN